MKMYSVDVTVSKCINIQPVDKQFNLLQEHFGTGAFQGALKIYRLILSFLGGKVFPFGKLKHST